jgi:hypothetical protein
MKAQAASVELTTLKGALADKDEELAVACKLPERRSEGRVGRVCRDRRGDEEREEGPHSLVGRSPFHPAHPPFRCLPFSFADKRLESAAAERSALRKLSSSLELETLSLQAAAEEGELLGAKAIGSGGGNSIW